MMILMSYDANTCMYFYSFYNSVYCAICYIVLIYYGSVNSYEGKSKITEP